MPPVSRRGRRVLPQQCILRRRVEAALDSGLEGAERKDVERWLGGARMLRTTTGRSHKVGRANVGTGEMAHEWALILKDEIERRELVIDDQPEFTDSGREVLRALGVRLVTV